MFKKHFFITLVRHYYSTALYIRRIDSRFFAVDIVEDVAIESYTPLDLRSRIFRVFTLPFGILLFMVCSI